MACLCFHLKKTRTHTHMRTAVRLAKMASLARSLTSTSMVNPVTTNYKDYNKMENTLINAVYRFPELYDLTLISYKNSQQKEMAWKKISEHVCVPGKF